MVEKMKNILRKTVFYRMYKKYYAKTANLINKNPSNWMFIVWITWTNWKTTTSAILHKIFNDNLWKTLLINTINIKIWDEEVFNDSKMTSLDAFSLQQLLSFAKSKWCKYAILEVSSHWIDQYRFEWIEFDMGILTNITAEHLDYHKTFEDYAKTKKKLFLSILANSKSGKYAVFPKDDKIWREWIEDIAIDNILDFGLQTNATVTAEKIDIGITKSMFDLKYLWEKHPVESNLTWRFNIKNILAAYAAGILSWIEIKDIIKSVSNFEALPWRIEHVEKNNVQYFIDFAHTPDSLEKSLEFVNDINKDNWRIITLFGSPWNRDKYKRPQMWEIVEKNSDIFIITDDDPDTEDRLKIINDIMKNLTKKKWKDYFVIPERSYAIKFLTEITKPWDKVLLAGKGHENVQLTNFWKVSWNDKRVLLKLLDNPNEKNWN